MTEFESLRYYPKFSRLDFSRFMRQLLPRGPIWQIPFEAETEMILQSIPSGEAFGRVTISTGDTLITPEGIPSEEAFGATTVFQEIGLLGIPTQKGWGTPLVWQKLIQAQSIISSESFGAPGLIQFPSSPLQGQQFDDGVGSNWDSEFSTDWSLVTDNEQQYMLRGADSDDQLYPASPGLMTGDFEVYYGQWVTIATGGNNSVHLGIKGSGGIYKGELGWWLDAVREVQKSAVDDYLKSEFAPGYIHMKWTRVSGVMWGYYWDNTAAGWKRMDAWSTPQTSISFADDLFLAVNGASTYGIGYVYIYGNLAP